MERASNLRFTLGIRKFLSELYTERSTPRIPNA